MEKEKKSQVQQQMEDNAILSFWTQTWGIKIRPSYAIDKLRFDFVEKGQDGKGKSFVLYMDTLKDGAACFDNWAWEILHDNIMFKTLAAEKKAGEKYPKAYRYITGEDGSSSIGIMNSSSGSGYCINASIVKDGKKIFANVPVSHHDLRRLAERYVKTYQRRLKELDAIQVKAEEASNAYFSNRSASSSVSKPAVQQPAQPTNREEQAPSSSADGSKPALITAVVRTTSQISGGDNEDLRISVVDENETRYEMVLPAKYRERHLTQAGDLLEQAKTKVGLYAKVQYYSFKGRYMVRQIIAYDPTNK